MLLLKRIHACSFKVMWNGSKYIGEIYMESDGYYVYDIRRDLAGFLDEHFLRTIADKLAKMNKPWDDKLKKELT
jgi:hypothetical protein